MIRAAAFSAFLVLTFAGVVTSAQTNYQTTQQQLSDQSAADAAYDRQDWQTALPLLSRLADSGDAHSEILLGIMYRDAKGVTRDYAKAAELFQEASAQNDIFATYVLANAYYAGNGVAQDYVQAAKLYAIAADGGDPYAQVDIGYAYEMGYGVQQDYVTSLKWALITRSVVANSHSNFDVDPKEIARHNNAHIAIAVSHLNAAQIQSAKTDAITWLTSRSIDYDDAPLPKPFSYTPYIEAAAGIFCLYAIAKLFLR